MCSGWQDELLCFFGGGERTVERGCAVSKGVPCLCELNKPSVTYASRFIVWEGASGIQNRGNGPWKALCVCLSYKGEPLHCIVVIV